MDQVKYIFYSIGSYYAGHEIVCIEKKDKSVVLKGNLHGMEIDSIEYLSLPFMNEVLFNIEPIINAWKYEYSNPDILDGTQWELLISTYSKDKTDNLMDNVDDLNEIQGIRFFSGSNDYPENFEQISMYMDVLRRMLMISH